MLQSERAEFERLLAASDRVVAACAFHPCPPPKPGSRIIPKACTCYTEAKEWQEFMSWRSRECDICGGIDRCKPSCDASDKRE